MELEVDFELEANLDLQLDLHTNYKEDQNSLCQSPSQMTTFLFSNSNPLSENSSNFISIFSIKPILFFS